MLVTYIRSSSYNNYSFCQMQYFLTYVLGYQTDSGKKAELGTIVHKVSARVSSCGYYRDNIENVFSIRID